MLTEDIDHRFSFHPANEVTGPQHDLVRGILLEAASQLDEILPGGREASLVMTKLEEAMFWANAAVARAGR